MREEIDELIGYFRFVEAEAGGLFVRLDLLDEAASFQRFIEQLFTAELYFRQLNYPVFSRLLYDFEKARRIVRISAGKGKAAPRVRLAQEVVPFVDERKQLYRGLKIKGKKPEEKTAEYLFDRPIRLVRKEVAGKEVEQEVEITLDRDEFIAALWTQGVRAGLDMVLIERCVGSPGVQRETVASAVPPQAGNDAGYEEVSKLLHRDLAPQEVSRGKVSFKRYRNTFPQVAAGVELLRKIPLHEGVPGRDIHGGPIFPQEPVDLDLALLCGPGTRIERKEEGLFLVSAIEGFISIDNKSGKISVEEQLINRDGVGSNTGDLDIVAEHFVTEGDVVENYQLEGYNLLVRGNVYGRVLSKRGTVTIEGNVSAGEVECRDGDLLLKGAMASRCRLTALHGKVVATSIENSTVFAREIEIDSARNALLIGDRIRVGGTLLGCNVMARFSDIQEIGEPRDGRGCRLSVAVPDRRSFDKRITTLTEQLEGQLAEVEAYEAELASLLKDPILHELDTLHQNIRSLGAEGMLDDDKQRLKRLSTEAKPQLMRRDEVRKRLSSDRDAVIAETQQLEQAHAEWQKLAAGIGCRIGKATGMVMVCTQVLRPSADTLVGHELDYLRPLVESEKKGGETTRVLFEGSPEGGFEWQMGDQLR